MLLIKFFVILILVFLLIFSFRMDFYCKRVSQIFLAIYLYKINKLDEAKTKEDLELIEYEIDYSDVKDLKDWLFDLTSWRMSTLFKNTKFKILNK